MATTTTVKLKLKTVERLNGFGAFKDSYDSVVNKLLDACDILRSAQLKGETLADTAKRLVLNYRSQQSKSEILKQVTSPV